MFYYIFAHIIKQTTERENLGECGLPTDPRADRRLCFEGYYGGGRALFYGDGHDLFA
jgi:hypothetical protein